MSLGERFIYDFERLNVYQEAFSLSKDVYHITRQFPKEEQYGLTSQLRRAAVSVALNIAEGKARYHTKVLIQFLYQSRGSLAETIALIKLSHELDVLNEQEAALLLDKADKIFAYLNNFIRTLSNQR